MLSDGKGFVYSTKTSETTVRYDLSLPALLKGASYSVLVNTYVTDQEKSYIIYGDESKLSFTYVPICSIPKNVQISEVDQDHFAIAWAGRPAIPGDVEYKIRYRDSQTKAAWIESTTTVGNSVRISGTNIYSQNLEIEICKVCYWEDGSIILSDWVKVPLSSPETPTLPPFICGAVYNYNAVSCSPALPNSSHPSLIYIGGFPIEVQTISFVESYWSGTGLAPLPFGNGTLVKVEWQNVRINSSFQVCSGEVTGVSDNPANYPNLNPGPAAFGGEICIPIPSTPGFDSAGIHNVTGLPWDPRGFGPTGLYVKQPPYPGYQTGFPYDSTMIYDPNGFDEDGIHAITGTLFNPQGCNANGVDSLGQPCNPITDPYAWMNPSGGSSTQEGLQFAGEVKDTIGSLLQSILTTLNNQAQDSLVFIPEYLTPSFRSFDPLCG